jgi:hypothetical protein
MMLWWFVIRVLFLACFLVLLVTGAFGQNEPANHQAYHNDYIRWASQKTGNCCNNQDCRPLKPEEWRQSEVGLEIKIEDQWCPVNREHFLIRGKSPNGDFAHACIRPVTVPWLPPCTRLLCFVGIPGG